MRLEHIATIEDTAKGQTWRAESFQGASLDSAGEMPKEIIFDGHGWTLTKFHNHITMGFTFTYTSENGQYRMHLWMPNWYGGFMSTKGKNKFFFYSDGSILAKRAAKRGTSRHVRRIAKLELKSNG